MRSLSTDMCISRDKFLSLEKIWDTNGVYAIFTKIYPIKFRARELEDLKRYNALKNFDWNLEIRIPSPNSYSGEWTTITSPNKEMIDLIKNTYYDMSK